MTSDSFVAVKHFKKEGEMNKKDSPSKPKILIFDIETAPNLGWVWGMWEQNVIEFEKDWYIMSFVAKWLDSDKIISCSLPDFPLYKRDKENDKEVVRALWKLLDEADVVVGHNGDAFDIKKCQTRFLQHGMNPPTPFLSVDTKKVAKRYFRFDSNKLDELGRHLGLGRKIDNGGFKLWKGCMAGDMTSWRAMMKYNRQDVILLEKVYLKLRPWMKNHPNFNIFTGIDEGCPNCGSRNLVKRGMLATRTGLFQRYACKGCGAWSQGRSEKREKGSYVIR